MAIEGLKRKLRERGAEFAPPSTRRRSVGRAGLNSYRAGVDMARVVRTTGGQLLDDLGVRDRRTDPLGRQRQLAHERVPGAAAASVHTTTVRVVVVGGERAATRRTLDSVLGQWWPHWEAVVLDADVDVDDPRVASSAVSDASAVIGETDPRSPALVVRAGDVLEADLFFRVADAFWQNPEIELVHWDDDMAGADGNVLRFRPEWSPDLLLSANYLGRSFALRAGSWSSFVDARSPSAWWDLLLGLELDRFQVQRLPLVLATVGSRPDPTPYGSERLVQRVLDRRGWPATAVPGDAAIHLRWELPEWPSVSIVIPSRFNQAMLDPLFATLERTQYPNWDLTVIDNSGEDPAKDEWYGAWADRLPLSVQWWDQPFNYSTVNNVAARTTAGDVLVFLNDDTRVLDQRWLKELAGWATRPEIGTVGLQLINGDGLIQHGGVVMGIDGFAGHLFAGDLPGGDTMIGHRNWTRNTSAVTAACVAVRRDVFDGVGGFDERFELCGSDVVLGLDMLLQGLRNVCSTGSKVEHLEAVTRGDTDVTADMYASYWRYQRWLAGGDRYYSPNLSLVKGAGSLRPTDEPSPLERVLPSLGRSYGVFRQSMSEAEAYNFAELCRVGDAIVDEVVTSHFAIEGHRPVRTVNWFLPEFDNPFYGGINTILRIADQLRRDHDVENRFIMLAGPNEAWYRSSVRAAFPELADVAMVFVPSVSDAELAEVPPADAAIATIWHSAYAVARAPGQVRRFYLVQDFEPAFYPAGTMYALAEETYRLGLYGICNTEPMATMFRERYDGTGSWFLPAVDREIFRPATEPRREGPIRIFLYARPGHWRNCWEIASLALRDIKKAGGDDVHIVTAGSWARPEDLGQGIEHLGLLDYRETGELYRRCDIGIALTVSEHPSYLPLELMACGVPVVAFDLPEAYWILHHDINALRARQTVEGLREQLDKLVRDPELRARLAAGALSHIDEHHSDWRAALRPIHGFLEDPVGSSIEQLRDHDGNER